MKIRGIILREVRIFAPYFAVVSIVSLYSAINKNSVAGNSYTEFYPSLFFLHLVSWVIIYAVIRGAVLLKRAWKK